MALSSRQQIFADAILSGSTGKAAAIAAGYSSHTAESQASRLLRNANVKAFLDAKQAKAVKEAELSAKDVLVAVKEGIDFDPARAFDERGNLLTVPDMPLDVRRNLRGFKVTRIPGRDDGAELVELKWTPRSEWTGQAARVLGLNRDKLELDVRSLADLAAEAARRAKGAKP